MSRYVVLISADCDVDGLTGIYAITVSSNPALGLRTLQSYCPVQCKLIHAIESASRTEDLERTLHIKHANRHLHSFWFQLNPEDVTFIQSINTDNLTRISGMIKRSLAPPPAPVIAPEALPDFIQEQLDLYQKLQN